MRFKHAFGLAMGLSIVLALQLAPGQSVHAEPQVDVRIRVKAHDWLGAAFEQRIGNGPATVSGQIYNLTGRQTSLVTLHFDYQSHNEFVLDEIITRIVVTIADLDGQQLGSATIEPNFINLNPDRVPLDYSATLYNTTGGKRTDYVARVQVFGNYE